MRITKAETQKREAFVRDRFARDPNLSIPKMTELLKAEFHQSMNLARLYALREEARAAGKATPTTTL